MVAVLGRRRVGKTFLVRSFFEGRLDFELVGLKDGTNEQQLRNFAYSLKDARRAETLGAMPKDWLDAFFQLKTYLEVLDVPTRKKTIFIDEVRQSGRTR
jgi:AAA+ ATPase superfamily predicted ATPase